jgi:hypothetical protein
LTISAITILPTKPVPHTTMRLVSESFTAFTIGGLAIIGDQLRQSLDLLSEFLDLSPGRRLIGGVFLGDALHDPRGQATSTISCQACQWLALRVGPVPGEAIDSWLEATAGRMDMPLGAVERAGPSGRYATDLAQVIPGEQLDAVVNASGFVFE